MHQLCLITAGGVFPGRGWNLCPLHWRVDSFPLSTRDIPDRDLESAGFLPRVLKYHRLGRAWCVLLTREQVGLRLLMGAAPPPPGVWRLSPGPRSMLLLTSPRPSTTRRCTAGYGWRSEVGVCVSPSPGIGVACGITDMRAGISVNPQTPCCPPT